ncbi:uncharacterized protein L203_103109 [Cryptococcus depauperatus CBS 7841]|uniref:Uncharacterized protein n=1 Tax=Cryptococcus depauperatus CBS 7841 TaxID=1295531 RepID=A0AAJ8JT68_9TREE
MYKWPGIGQNAEGQPGFLLRVLDLVKAEATQISAMDKAPIKTQLVPLMISLGTPQTAKLQSQIGKGWGYIISLDFPDDWEGLCDELQLPILYSNDGDLSFVPMSSIAK